MKRIFVLVDAPCSMNFIIFRSKIFNKSILHLVLPIRKRIVIYKFIIKIIN